MDFWAKHSPLDFPHREVTLTEIRRETNRRLKKASVTVELPQHDVQRLKQVATARGVNYKSLAAEMLHQQLAKTGSRDVLHDSELT